MSSPIPRRWRTGTSPVRTRLAEALFSEEPESTGGVPGGPLSSSRETDRLLREHGRLSPREVARVRARARSRVIAPILRRVLFRLVGWRYTGGDADRRRLVRERPLLAVHPAAPTRLPP